MAEEVTSLKTLQEFLGEANIKVVVPKIQRAYAQGREGAKNIRSLFVDELFNALDTDTQIELSFVYGSKVTSENGVSRFELLDGQQRVTTLVLLHWFLACAAKREIPQYIKVFNYETRTTSEDFLTELSKNPIDISNEKPSDAIRDRQWYTPSFDKDNSVLGMLNMLDAIHERYQAAASKDALFDRLDNIKFYELDLDDFGLTEEIYVKMNARGLQLTPFENFKADLIKLLKDETIPEYSKQVEMDIVGRPMVPYYLNISQKIDNRWLDIFWSKDDNNSRDYCDKFFSFFYRYFTYKYYLEIAKDIDADIFRQLHTTDSHEGKIWNFLTRLSPAQDNIYFGFKYYDEFFRHNPIYMDEIEHLLDTLSKPGVYDAVKGSAIIPWEKGEKNSMRYFDAVYQQSDQIYFAAVFEYLKRNHDAFDEVNFRRWMRIIRNIVENNLLRNVDDMIRVIRRVVLLLDLPGAMDNIYKSIAYEKLDGREARSLKEETYKARIIVENPEQDWEAAFNKTEEHPFFRGAIGFLLENLPNDVDKFIHRYEILAKIFDEKGMSDEMKENHRLIRSMVRTLNSPTLLDNTAITEREDRTHHLKVVMLEKEPVRILMSKLGDLANIEEVTKYLDAYCDNPEIEYAAEVDSLIPAEPDEKFKTAFKKLCLDNQLYDFVIDVEQRNRTKYVAVQNRYDCWAICRPGSWHDWLFIGTDRTQVLDELFEMGFRLDLDHDGKVRKMFGEYNDFRIWLHKDLEDGNKLSVESHPNGKLWFVFKADNPAYASLLPGSTPHFKVDGWQTLYELDGHNASCFEAIREKITFLENLFETANYV